MVVNVHHTTFLSAPCTRTFHTSPFDRPALTRGIAMLWQRTDGLFFSTTARVVAWPPSCASAATAEPGPPCKRTCFSDGNCLIH